MEQIRAFIDSKFQIPVIEGADKVCGEETFTLTIYIPNDTSQKEKEVIAEIKKKAGWELKVASNLKRAELPTKDEIDLLRLFDPKGFFVGS